MGDVKTIRYNKGMSDYDNYEDLYTGLKILNAAPPKHDDFAVISPCFYKKEPEMVANSKKLFNQEEIKYITYGKGERFSNKVYTNLLRLYVELSRIEKQFETVLVMDAYDTLYLGGGTILMLLSKFRNINRKEPTVILASETNCYPSGSDIFYSNLGNLDQAATPAYLNSGLILGPTNLIKVMIGEMIQKYDLQRFELNNESLSHSQIYWHRYLNEGRLKNNIMVDYSSSFFFCMSSCDPYRELEIINPVKIRVKNTNTFPKIFHFNRCFVDEYKLLFGEFWVNSLDIR